MAEKKLEEQIEDIKKVVVLGIKSLGTLLWTAGFMFTLGIIGVNPELSTYPVLDQIAIWILSYIFWPIVLGSHFNK